MQEHTSFLTIVMDGHGHESGVDVMDCHRQRMAQALRALATEIDGLCAEAHQGDPQWAQ